MVRLIGRSIMAAAMLVPLAACGTLPQVGPSASDIANQAADTRTAQFLLVDIDPTVLSIARSRAPDSFYTSFGASSPSVSPQLGIGDMVQVTIWEAGPGGLFSTPLTTSGFSSGSANTTIPPQVISTNGKISIPFAGEIQAAGRTTEQVQNAIAEALGRKAVQPQVLVTMVKQVSNTVTITGEVAAGARVPLSLTGDRLLDIIASAGGVRSPVSETVVQLSRGRRTERVPLQQVVDNPRENIYMRPGDVVTLVRDPQVFLAYGATGSNAEVPFTSVDMTLSNALVKAGGLIDNRSDAAGVFVLRYEPDFIASKLRPGSPLVHPGEMTPVMYRLDLHQANSMFMASRFPIFDNDAIYVSNAPLTNVQKAMQIFTLISGPTGTTASLYNALN